MTDDVATVQAIYGCFGRGDIGGVLAHLDPDVEWEHDWGMEPPPLYAPRRGRAGAADFFAALVDYEFIRFEPVAFLSGKGASGERMVAVPIHIELRHRPTGRTIRDLEAHLWTFGADGKVTRLRHILDTRQVP